MLPGRSYSPEHLLEAAWRHRWVVFFPLVLGAGAAALYARQLPDVYRAEATIAIVPQRVPENYVRSAVTIDSAGRIEAIGREILSRTRLEPIIRRLHLVSDETPLTEELVDGVRNNIGIADISEGAFRLSFVASDPQTAKETADLLTALFLAENRQERAVYTKDTNSFLATELDGARSRLLEQEQRLEAYRRRFAGQLPSQLDTNLQGLRNAQLRLQTIEASLERDRERRLTLGDSQGALGDLSAGADGDASAPGPAATALAEARERRRDLEGRLTAAHPDVIELEALIRDLEKGAAAEDARPGPDPSEGEREAAARAVRHRQAVEELAAQITEKEAQQAQLEEDIARYESRIAAIPARESELVELTRDYGAMQDLYAKLLAQYQESTVAANLERHDIAERFRVLDPPRLPEEPIAPNRGLFVLYGLALGAALGCGLALLLDYRDATFRHEEDVREVLTLPVLAAIPDLPIARDRRMRMLRLAGVSAAAVAAVAASGAAVAWTLDLIGRP